MKEVANRSYVLLFMMCFLGAAILIKVVVLQVSPNEQGMKIRNHLTHVVREVPSIRGQILSSDGKPLATSVPEYEVYWDSRAPFDRQEFDIKLDSLALCFSKVMGDRTASEYASLFRTARKNKERYQIITRKADAYQLNAIKSFPFIRHKQRTKTGFIYVRNERRVKPMGDLAARTIGLNRDSSKVGIEQAYDKVLAGVNGKQVCQKIPGGIWLPMEDDWLIEPESGSDVVTTINVHLQDVAHTALLRQLNQSNARWGCVVLMDVETGFVRAISNLMLNEETGEYEESLNLAISRKVEPGSTFKLASLMACLDEGKTSLDDSVATGNGVAEFCGRKMRDSNWDKGGNGTLTVEQVFERSSNIGTATVVKKAFGDDPERFLKKLQQFGIGESLKIDLAGEPNPLLYKKAGDEGWSGCSLTSLAIGYETEQTPLQTLAFYNAVANGGKMVRPQFVQEIRKNGRTVERMKPDVIRRDFCKKETLAKCRKMMEGVMEKGGTADYVFKNSPYSVAGKTGTAWINESGGYVNQSYRASFVGYFPADEPKYSCIVVIHDPKGAYYGSAVAAPVFKDLADKIYSTEMEFHEPVVLADSLTLAHRMMPASKNGSGHDLRTVLHGLDIPTPSYTESEWISTRAGVDSVFTSERKVVAGLVPNVSGMGLQDALYLLEKTGMRVQIYGTGRVIRQSVTPGASVKANPFITIELS